MCYTQGEKTKMYAIADFMGKQFRIAKDMILQVPFIADAEAGANVKIENILMIDVGDKVSFGKPTIEKAHAVAEVLKHGREKKIIVFKKKRRKGYRKTQGHRQDFTEIKIKNINY